MEIISVYGGDHLTVIKELFLEYAESLGFNLCFQNFEEEMASLPGKYAAPEGVLLLGYSDGRAAGCAALKKLSAGVCEMKRLYVRPEFRGRGYGKLLAGKIMDEARLMGYERIRLDTIGFMTEAIDMYKKMGFYTIEPYYHNPVQGAIFMEMIL